MKSISASLVACATAVLAASGDGDWASAYTKAEAALAKLSNEEKVGLATGLGWQKGACVGNVAAISSIGFPELCLQDGPLGYVHLHKSRTECLLIFQSVRYAQKVTAFPAGIMAGATWDPALMYDRGNALGMTTND